MILDCSFPRETDYVTEKNLPLVIVGGTVEYHGAHCSYGCDTLIAEGLVKKLAEEKEMIFIVTHVNKKKAIMEAIMRDAGIESKAHTLLFSMPVTATAGFRLFDADTSAENPQPKQ